MESKSRTVIFDDEDSFQNSLKEKGIAGPGKNKDLHRFLDDGFEVIIVVPDMPSRVLTRADAELIVGST
jgi:hypothetical protein